MFLQDVKNEFCSEKRSEEDVVRLVLREVKLIQMFGLFIVERESYGDDVATHPLHALLCAFLSCNSTSPLPLLPPNYLSQLRTI